MSLPTKHCNWTITWTFHLHTPQKADIARLFKKVTERTGLNLQIHSSGLREARPGSWVRAEQEFAGSLGDAVVDVLETARKFGAHVDVTGPALFDGNQISFCGWMHESSHSELAAVEFELRNFPSADRSAV